MVSFLWHRKFCPVTLTYPGVDVLIDPVKAQAFCPVEPGPDGISNHVELGLRVEGGQTGVIAVTQPHEAGGSEAVAEQREQVGHPQTLVLAHQHLQLKVVAS